MGDENETEAKKPGFFKRLFGGLEKTRKSIADAVGNVFSYSRIDDEFYEDLEETLIMADVGIGAADEVIDSLREKVKENKVKDPAACRELLADSLVELMKNDDDAYDFEKQKSVVILIGVNGVGKTTSAGKLAAQFAHDGKKVILAAADTFRAAAIEQLTEWAHRADVPIIAQSEGSDPAAVVFDAISSAKAKNADILICDTAGRLHNKKNLMNELGKIYRVIEREYSDAKLETLAVVDATTGQNAKEQAKQFSEVAHIDGIVLTKLDGSAKGGIAIAIEKELGIPVKYIGVGEQIDDLQKFDARAFVNALLGVEEESAEEISGISDESTNSATENTETEPAPEETPEPVESQPPVMEDIPNGDTEEEKLDSDVENNHNIEQVAEEPEEEVPKKKKHWWQFGKG